KLIGNDTPLYGFVRAGLVSQPLSGMPRALRRVLTMRSEMRSLSRPWFSFVLAGSLISGIASCGGSGGKNTIPPPPPSGGSGGGSTGGSGGGNPGTGGGNPGGSGGSVTGGSGGGNPGT